MSICICVCDRKLCACPFCVSVYLCESVLFFLCLCTYLFCVCVCVFVLRICLFVSMCMLCIVVHVCELNGVPTRRCVAGLCEYACTHEPEVATEEGGGGC